MSVCRSCAAPVKWATVAHTGRRMPIDADPHPDGNIILEFDEFAGLTMAVVRSGGPDLEAARATDTAHRSHFATCPHADDHRRGRS